MDHFQQQIDRFWKNRMTPAEKQQFLADFLENEEAWKKRLESRYGESLEQEEQTLPEERAQVVLQRIHAQIGAPAEQPRTKVRWIRRIAVAAALIAGMVILYDHLRPSGNKVPPASAVNALLLRSNTGSVPQTLYLPDSSVVTLAPGSAIRYYAHFTATARDISLSGEARFRVAKDEARPFTVYAGDVMTTALGTYFMVSAPLAGEVTVKLFEGKVVVRPAAEKDRKKAVYMQPGEELQFSGSKLIKHAREEKETVQRPVPLHNSALPEFVQEPLANVLSAVGKRYKVHFQYSEEAISSMHVTGKFLPSDALKDVLSILGTVNGLSFQFHGDTITVSRSQ